jgi:hypothetical protein
LNDSLGRYLASVRSGERRGGRSQADHTLGDEDEAVRESLPDVRSSTSPCRKCPESFSSGFRTVFLTAHQDDTVRLRALEFAAGDCLLKPSSETDLGIPERD